ncbi:hypothetical protein TUBRATIS_17210 [Tubulinosema ratisbonensis]|uniref:Uncharacterized protein n=1 Tax=Tubulinosema ratisbonensis TaxID=291195 RepID=A0A437AL36_9MICR|nr:hypothetical protein TUBRATIS_17210 [Tubulinosema ratisbonensis]
MSKSSNFILFFVIIVQIGLIFSVLDHKFKIDNLKKSFERVCKEMNHLNQLTNLLKTEIKEIHYEIYKEKIDPAAFLHDPSIVKEPVVPYEENQEYRDPTIFRCILNYFYSFFGYNHW